MNVRTTYRIDFEGRQPIETTFATVAQAYAEDNARVTAVSCGEEA